MQTVHTKVFQKEYGAGEIVKTIGQNYYVSFSGKMRVFEEDAFNKGYLSLYEEDAALLENDREIVINAAENKGYFSIFEALNETVGTSYTGWMKATWPSNDALPFRLWFPKLAETKNGVLIPAANECLNILSSDWNEISYEDLKDNLKVSTAYTGITLVFAKEPNGGPYIFRGAYRDDRDQMTEKRYVSRRIATRVKLIGKPSKKLELLDEFKQESNKPDLANENDLIFQNGIMDRDKFQTALISALGSNSSYKVVVANKKNTPILDSAGKTIVSIYYRTDGIRVDVSLRSKYYDAVQALESANLAYQKDSADPYATPGRYSAFISSENSVKAIVKLVEYDS